jgi:hypothetical protein
MSNDFPPEMVSSLILTVVLGINIVHDFRLNEG